MPMDLVSVKDFLIVLAAIIGPALALAWWSYQRIDLLRQANSDLAMSVEAGRAEILEDLNIRHHDSLEWRGACLRNLSDFREQVAKEYVTLHALERFEHRLILSIDKLGERFDRLVSPSQRPPGAR